jgi:hypothetical protein
MKRKNYFWKCDYSRWKKKIMWWIILSSVLTHGLLAVTFSCMVTNFMVRLSYLNGTLREEDVVLNKPLAVKISFIICLFTWCEDVWEEEVWPHTFLILALYASESVWLFLCFISWGRIPHYPLNRRLGGPQRWFRCFKTKRYFLFLLGTRTTFPQSSHCWLSHCNYNV